MHQVVYAQPPDTHTSTWSLASLGHEHPNTPRKEAEHERPQQHASLAHSGTSHNRPPRETVLLYLAGLVHQSPCDTAGTVGSCNPLSSLLSGSPSCTSRLSRLATGNILLHKTRWRQDYSYSSRTLSMQGRRLVCKPSNALSGKLIKTSSRGGRPCSS